jgi:hypothetical protein
MNKVYAIVYELRTPRRDYTPLYSAIKASGKWWHYLPSTWLVYTSESATHLWNRLAPHIQKNDSMLVIEVRNHNQGWLPKGAWDWINTYVPPP